MEFDVPYELAKHHGGASFLEGGLKFADTFELWGGLSGTDTVLDIGCGPGRMASGIGEKLGWTNSYVGFDVKLADIDFCQNVITKHHPNFKFFHFDLENSHYNDTGSESASSVRFPAEDSSIDFVFATSIYTHFYTEEIKHYLRETARVGRKTNLSSWFIVDEQFFDRRENGGVRFDFREQADDGTYIQDVKRPLDAVGHSIESIEQMYDQAGLKIDRIYKGAWKGTDLSDKRHSQDVIVSSLKT